MNNILTNQSQLNDYLHDFEPLKKEEVLEKFKDFDFNCGVFSFRDKMKRIISMPKNGKSTTIYWTSRGWSLEEALKKRTPVKKLPEESPMNINFWINKGLNETDAEFQIKSQRKLNKEYWIKRGFLENDAIEKSRQFQIESSKKLQRKLKNDLIFREKFTSKLTNNINYWLNLGFSESDAIIKLSERQSTFSLKKCQAKYGDEVGKEVWLKRQEKWKNSLSLSDYNGCDRKDSKTIDFFKKKYGTEWIEPYLCDMSFKDKDEVLYLTSFKDYKEMITTLINDKFNLGDISYLLKYKILEEVYSVSKSEMIEYLIDNCDHYNKTPEYYLKKYESSWVDKFIQDNYFRNKEEIKYLLSFENYQELIKYMVKEYRIVDIINYMKGKLISYYYKTNYKEMFNYFSSLDSTIKSKFGRMRYFNNHICRSDGEYMIAKFLVDNYIEYEYEKKYKNSLKRCDFYLTNYDFYIEYTGMYNIESCKMKYNIKEKFCSEHNLNFIFSNKIEEIKNKIIELHGN